MMVQTRRRPGWGRDCGPTPGSRSPVIMTSILRRNQRRVGRQVVLLVAFFVAGLAAGARGQREAKYQGGCTTAKCHDGYTKRTVVHGPVSMGTCDACHEEADKANHKFEFSAEGAELCTDCHDEGFDGATVHAPVEQGACLSCHNPHATDSKHLLVADSVGEMCAECHDEITEDLDSLHGPVAAGDCTSCHDPHTSDHPTLLFAAGTAVCAKCHADLLRRLTDGPFSHQPAREDCATCHDAHGGDNRMNLTMAAPELCLDCHEETAEAIEDAEVVHPPVIKDKTCLNCHDPHASAFDHGLLRAGMDLCLSCHDRELGDGRRKTADIARQLSEKPHHHGPIAQGDCSACHTAHGGPNFRLLTEPYPADFYVAYDEQRYALCFDCHDAEMLEDEETDETTEFRNGERNLHHLHVNRPVKGRTCRACHDPHASSKPKQIADTVRFGNWAIPINFEQTATGGSCAPGCHKPYRYDREEAVVNLPQLHSSR